MSITTKPASEFIKHKLPMFSPCADHYYLRIKTTTPSSFPHSFLKSETNMAASFVSYHACYSISYSLAKQSQYLSKSKLPKPESSRNGCGSTGAKINAVAVTETLDTKVMQTRQNIPTFKQFADPHRQALIIDNGVTYRQTVVIRSYEVGPDKTATLESILNLLQVKLELVYYLLLPPSHSFLYSFLFGTSHSIIYSHRLIGN